MKDWVDNAYLGIDQGPILLIATNDRSDFVDATCVVRQSCGWDLPADSRGGWLDRHG